MKSPFPGMDPYLEARWSDVHAGLIFAIKESLQPALPPDLRARTEEQVVLEGESGEPLAQYRPDVAALELPQRRPAMGSQESGGLAVVEAQPFTVRFFDGPQVDRFLQIVDVANGNRVVTAIEVLSPWNKSPGRLNAAYMNKVEAYAAADVNLVEIDLLRSPRGRLRVDVGDLPPERRSAYFVAVRPAGWPERWEMYSIPLRSPIPAFRVPLRDKRDTPVVLGLQPLIERAYAAGAHDDIDYSKPPEPPLDPQDEAWADALLRAAGRR